MKFYELINKLSDDSKALNRILDILFLKEDMDGENISKVKSLALQNSYKKLEEFENKELLAAIIYLTQDVLQDLTSAIAIIAHLLKTFELTEELKKISEILTQINSKTSEQ